MKPICDWLDGEKPQRWDSRGHFFAAAAEAMRRILVENARRKARVRHGGQMNRVELDDFAADRPERRTRTCSPWMMRSTAWHRPTPRRPTW